MRYAYIFELHRHVHEFVGPFNSYEDMIRTIISMSVQDWDNNMRDCIQDYMDEYDTAEELLSHFGIEVFRVEEEPINAQQIVDGWKKAIIEDEEAYEQQLKEQKDKNDKKEYERLKEKFEVNNG